MMVVAAKSASSLMSARGLRARILRDNDGTFQWREESLAVIARLCKAITGKEKEQVKMEACT